MTLIDIYTNLALSCYFVGRSPRVSANLSMVNKHIVRCGDELTFLLRIEYIKERSASVSLEIYN